MLMNPIQRKSLFLAMLNSVIAPLLVFAGAVYGFRAMEAYSVGNMVWVVIFAFLALSHSIASFTFFAAMLMAIKDSIVAASRWNDSITGTEKMNKWVWKSLLGICFFLAGSAGCAVSTISLFTENYGTVLLGAGVAFGSFWLAVLFIHSAVNGLNNL